jgi:IS5 family transposase
MRHGRKTSSQKSDGYKGHILAGGKDHSLITATVVTAANVADSEAVAELLDQQAENIAEPLNKLSGDTAYGGANMRIDMQACQKCPLLRKAENRLPADGSCCYS